MSEILNQATVLVLNRNWQATGQLLKPEEGSVDHVMPRSRGGQNTWQNGVWASKRVNTRKADRLLQEVGLELLSVPRVPKELPVTPLIRNAHRVEDWKRFPIRNAPMASRYTGRLTKTPWRSPEFFTDLQIVALPRYRRAVLLRARRTCQWPSSSS